MSEPNTKSFTNWMADTSTPKGPRRFSRPRGGGGSASARPSPVVATPAGVTDEREMALQQRVDSLARGFGCASKVAVALADDGPLASAVGFSFGDVLFGRVHVQRSLLNMLLEDEIEFVLAHELAHIHQNHSVVAGGTAIFRAEFERLARADAEVKTMLRLWDLWRNYQGVRGGRTPAADLLRASELDADFLAVRVTGNLASAIAALSKLVGGDLARSSHTWEALGTAFPAMTMRERIEELRLRTDGTHRL